MTDSYKMDSILFTSRMDSVLIVKFLIFFYDRKIEKEPVFSIMGTLCLIYKAGHYRTNLIIIIH